MFEGSFSELSKKKNLIPIDKSGLKNTIITNPDQK